jgi:glycosyltransferase involved in cell wall biosynthesis
MITAIIAAHNEGAGVERAVAALRGQSRPPERVLVISDESTDSTVDSALRSGAEVLLTVDNAHRKAGALNQALETVRLGPADLVLVLDPQAELPSGFLEQAVAALGDRNVGAVAARRGAGTGSAALVRWQALEDVHRAFGRYYDEGPVTGQLRLALDLETVGWRLSSPVGAETVPAAEAAAVREVAGAQEAADERENARVPQHAVAVAGR